MSICKKYGLSYFVHYKKKFFYIFRCLYEDYSQKQESKIRCIVHYFQRISHDMPKGVVSFERKVLPFEGNPVHISYPNANFWSISVIPLCKFEVTAGNLYRIVSKKNFF